MKTATLTQMAALVATLALGSTAIAGQGKGDDHQYMKHHGSHGDMGHREAGGERWRGAMAEALNLSDEQQAQIQAIHEAARAQGEPLREQYRAHRRAEQEALQGGAGEEQLKALAARTADSRVAMMLHRRETHDKVVGLLTEEQKARMEELKEERQARREARKEKWQQRSEEAE